MNDVYSVANVVLEKTNYSISNLRLNRFLYYIYGIYLSTQKQRPWSEQLVAWNYGPIFPSIYKEFKMYGSKRIKYPILRSGRDVDDIMNSIIDKVLDTFGHLSDAELITRTHHKNSPWSQAYRKTLIIPDKTISDYFNAYIIEEGVV